LLLADGRLAKGSDRGGAEEKGWRFGAEAHHGGITPDVVTIAVAPTPWPGTVDPFAFGMATTRQMSGAGLS
jgi:hypothetical protein